MELSPTGYGSEFFKINTYGLIVIGYLIYTFEWNE